MEKQLIWSKLIPLTEERIQGIENIPAVFRISKKDPDGKFYVVFVGDTTALKNELEQLRTDPKEKSFLLSLYILRGDELSFRYAQLADTTERKAVTKFLYKHYSPEANIEEPESDADLRVNLN